MQVSFIILILAFAVRFCCSLIIPLQALLSLSLFPCLSVIYSWVTSGPLTTTQVTTTLPARPFTSSASPSTARPLAPTSRPIGSINKNPDLRPITATVPVTRRPPHPPQGSEPQFCETKLVRGVQWPTTQRGETVDRPCPKGSLGEKNPRAFIFKHLFFFFYSSYELQAYSYIKYHVGVCHIYQRMCPSDKHVWALTLVFFRCCCLPSLRWSHQ